MNQKTDNERLQPQYDYDSSDNKGHSELTQEPTRRLRPAGANYNNFDFCRPSPATTGTAETRWRLRPLPGSQHSTTTTAEPTTATTTTAGSQTTTTTTTGTSFWPTTTEGQNSHRLRDQQRQASNDYDKPGIEWILLS